MKDRTRNEKIFEQNFGSSKPNTFSPNYKHKPTSPRVLIVGPQEEDKLKWIPNNHGGVSAKIDSGISTSPAAVGQGSCTITTGPIVDNISPLAQADEADVFGEPTPHNKFWVLVALGFAPVQKSVWYNKKLGIEISFDIEKEDLETLAFLIHQRGTLKGAQRLKEQFKLILDL